MALPPLESEYLSWSAGSALRIEYPAAALEDICADAVEALGRVRNGGVEIGGVLFGVHRDGILRMCDYRPLPCEYAYGPRFMLSERDRGAMRDLLSAPSRSPQLRGFQAVGWYHSHTRTDVVLSPRDLEIYDQFFPEGWQIAVVIRPEPHELSIAGFFVRESADRALFETDVRAYRHVQRVPEPPPPRAPEPGRTAGPVLVARGGAPSESARSKTPAPAGEAPPPLPSWARAEPKRRRWPWWKRKEEIPEPPPPLLPKPSLETLIEAPPPEPPHPLPPPLPPQPAPAAPVPEEPEPAVGTVVVTKIQVPWITAEEPAAETAPEAAEELAPEPVVHAAPEAEEPAPEPVVEAAPATAEPERSRWSWAKSKARLRKAEREARPAADAVRTLPERTTETGPVAHARRVVEPPPAPEPAAVAAEALLRMPAPPAPVMGSAGPFSPAPERLVLRDIPAPLPSFAQAAAPDGRRWFRVTVLVLLAAAAGVGGGWYWRTGGRHAPLALWVADVGGQLMIEWDRTARPIRKADRGTLEIKDGAERMVIQMDADKLKEGSVDYVRRSEIVDVKLHIALPDGTAADEMIRFVGPPIGQTAAAEVVRERDALKAEVERLTAELEKAQGAQAPNDSPKSP